MNKMYSFEVAGLTPRSTVTLVSWGDSPSDALAALRKSLSRQGRMPYRANLYRIEGAFPCLVIAR